MRLPVMYVLMDKYSKNTKLKQLTLNARHRWMNRYLLLHLSL